MDIWPLYLFHDGAQTLNIAISLLARAEIDSRDDGRIRIHSIDTGREIEVADWRDLDLSPGVDGVDPDTAIVARVDLGAGQQADRDVQRLRAVVEQVERPDVHGAAGEVDAGRSGRFDVHDSL